MSAATRKRAMRAQLHADFAKAMAFFKLPAENVRIAWESAERSTVLAAACYRAIVNSLPRKEPKWPNLWTNWR